MATNAIFQTPGIIQNSAAQYQNANRSIFDAITAAADMYERMQTQKQANLSAERIKQMEIDAQNAKALQEQKKAMFTDEGFQALLAKSQMAPESVTPEESAALRAGIQFRQSQMGQNPVTGGLYPKFQPTFDIGASQAPIADMMAPAPVSAVQQAPRGVADMLLPPPAAGNDKTSPSDYAKAMEAPAPVGAPAEKVEPKLNMPTGEMGATPVGKMKFFEKQLEFESNKLLKNFDKELDAETAAKQKNLVQQGLDRMYEINEALNKKGKIVSEKGSAVGNAVNMAKGAEIPIPFTKSSVKVGSGAETMIDPKTKALRDEYEKLRATMFPFFAKASGLSATAMDTEQAREQMMNAMGNPNGIYEANRNQLETVSKLIGTGSLGKGRIDERDPRVKKALEAGYTMDEIKAFMNGK